MSVLEGNPVVRDEPKCSLAKTGEWIKSLPRPAPISMLFNTIQFGLFYVVVLVLYSGLTHRWQNRMLLVASYVFYAAWDVRFCALMLVSTAVDYYVGIAVHKSRDDARRKRLLIASIITNLGILGFFKYFGFFMENFQVLMESFGLEFHAYTMAIILPVGISFYTFQSMSYTIDIYRGKLEPCRNSLDFALYVSLFPQLVAGPIERATHLVPQVLNERKRSLEMYCEGFHLILWGLFKKVVIADNMAAIVDPIFANETGLSFGQVVVGTVAFAFQIYGDFSGYSDIARGVAKTLGFDLMVNFNLPYLATSPQDFWRRWHISLSTWLRDYLYISLGGNKKGPRRTYVNLAMTMVLGGLWHGAAWTFVIWGIYQGALLAIHRSQADRLAGLAPAGRIARSVWKWVCIGFMFLLTLYGWLIFRAESFTQIVSMTGALMQPEIQMGTLRELAKIGVYLSLLLVVQFFQYRSDNLMVVQTAPAWLQAVFYLACFYLIIGFGTFNAQSFIYFQF